MQIVELEEHPDNEFRADLDDREYLFRFHYLERFDSWIMDLLDVAGAPIIEGLPVVLDKPLLSQVVDERRPDGDLMFVQLGNDDVPPGFVGFASKYILYYLTAEEMDEGAAIAAEATAEAAG
jgi:hypothetical protein